MSRLLEDYKNNMIDDLKKRLNLNNIHEVPKLTKIVINMGIGDAKDDSKLIDKAQEELSLISGKKLSKQKQRKQLQVLKLELACLRLFSNFRNKKCMSF